MPSVFTVGALALATLAAAATVCQGAPVGGPGSASEIAAGAELGIIEQTNAFRARNGLPATVPNPILAAEARGFASFLAGTQAFSHTADGYTPSERADAAGYRSCVLAENIARVQGFGRQGVAPDAGSLSRQFVAGWEASPGHRRNMLDPDVTETGVAVASDDNADTYAAVQVFGRPESLRFSFRVENRSDMTVSVTYGGEPHVLRTGAGVVYTTCTPGSLTFDRRISGPGVLQPQRDRVYRLRSAPGGDVLLEVLGGDPSARAGGPAHLP